jgi:hypothetical protein
LAIDNLLRVVRVVQHHAHCGEITRTMHRSQASTDGAPSHARVKPSALPSLAIQSFASFQSQTSSHPIPVAVQVRRKPLPIESPVIGRFAWTSSSPAQQERDKGSAVPQDPRRQVLSPPLTEDDALFVPRNLDEYERTCPPRTVLSLTRPQLPPRTYPEGTPGPVPRAQELALDLDIEALSP